MRELHPVESGRAAAQAARGPSEQYPTAAPAGDPIHLAGQAHQPHGRLLLKQLKSSGGVVSSEAVAEVPSARISRIDAH